VRVPLSALSLTLADLDDRRPERPTTFSFEARVGAFGGARAAGAVFPFAPRLSFDIEFAANAIDLPPISAYADQALGVDVRTGTASVEGRVAARDAALDGRTKWRIANARLDEREAGTGELAQHAGAPVGLALSLLADADNNIELEIPVAGDLDNPSFDTGDAVRQAVGGALKGALTGTLGVLFPFGSLISGLVDDDRRGRGIKLPDIAFAAGTGTMDAKAGEALDAVAKVLGTRPAARLEVCGFAGPADVAGKTPDEDALRELAAARTEAVKRRLVEGARVDAARVFECRPVVETKPDALPRAELRF
jgi:outer membrane protein OmpA-like peptidoglycan-associated protein